MRSIIPGTITQSSKPLIQRLPDPGGWKQIEPDKWRTLPDKVNKDAIFIAQDDPNRPGKKLPLPVRRPWSRLVRWLGLKGIHFDSGGLDPSCDDGVDIDGIDGTGQTEAAPTAGTTMAQQLMAYAQRCLARRSCEWREHAACVAPV